MKYTLIIFIGLLLASCTNEENTSAGAAKAVSDTAHYTNMLWLDSNQNLGNLNFGEKAEVTFHFKNTGTNPLYLVSVVPGCGCTAADFPKEAIVPGKSGEIVAKFDTEKSHEGDFTKFVTVTANTRVTTSHILSFSGVIKPKDKSNSKTSSSQ